MQRASYAGHVWVFANWVRGLRQLGHRVVFVDRVSGPEGTRLLATPSVRRAIELLGGHRGVSVLDDSGAVLLGLPRETLVAIASTADVLFNIMGYLDDPAILAGPRRRVFVDIDPGFGQMWRMLGLADVFAGHDAFVTVATSVEHSSIPLCGLKWIATMPPVQLGDWPVASPLRSEAPITSIASWRGPNGPVEFEGTTYGLRVHEFRRFLELPRHAKHRFELAVDIDPADRADIEALSVNGWWLVDPARASASPDAYRRYIAGSRAELMIAKNMYVATKGGWFSDRSACYLAAGRPVLAQNTGLRAPLVGGDGLLLFDDVDGLVSAIADLDERYDEHCEAARTFAEDHLSADLVLQRVLDQVA